MSCRNRYDLRLLDQMNVPCLRFPLYTSTRLLVGRCWLCECGSLSTLTIAPALWPLWFQQTVGQPGKRALGPDRRAIIAWYDDFSTRMRHQAPDGAGHDLWPGQPSSTAAGHIGADEPRRDNRDRDTAAGELPSQ